MYTSRFQETRPEMPWEPLNVHSLVFIANGMKDACKGLVILSLCMDLFVMICM